MFAYTYLFLQKLGLFTSIMSEKESFNNDSPKTSILLEKNFFINNYKALKIQMEPDEIIDYLVQYHILDTEENTRLIDKGRSRKCDFILRKLIRDPDCRSKLKELIEKETQLQEVQCFSTLLHQRPTEVEHATVVQGRNLPPPPLIKKIYMYFAQNILLMLMISYNVSKCPGRMGWRSFNPPSHKSDIVCKDEILSPLTNTLLKLISRYFG